jgi:hypothetical protein
MKEYRPSHGPEERIASAPARKRMSTTAIDLDEQSWGQLPR